MPEDSEQPEPNYNPFPPGQNRRATVTEVEVEDMGNMLRRAFVGRDVKFTIYCDEGPNVGGKHTAPAPLSYFAASIAF